MKEKTKSYENSEGAWIFEVELVAENEKEELIILQANIWRKKELLDHMYKHIYSYDLDDILDLDREVAIDELRLKALMMKYLKKEELRLKALVTKYLKKENNFSQSKDVDLPGLS